MTTPNPHPPSGDFDYNANRGTHTAGYGIIRRADPRIEAQIHAALGNAKTVLNIGAGAGSYEPKDRHVVAVEPAAAMRSRRPAHAVPAIIGSAESLPFDDRAFDAAMGTLTVHQWRDRAAGLREVCRVTRHTIVLLTFDPESLHLFWLNDYISGCFWLNDAYLRRGLQADLHWHGWNHLLVDRRWFRLSTALNSLCR